MELIDIPDLLLMALCPYVLKLSVKDLKFLSSPAL
jgi:hypothetical protein